MDTVDRDSISVLPSGGREGPIWSWVSLGLYVFCHPQAKKRAEHTCPYGPLFLAPVVWSWHSHCVYGFLIGLSCHLEHACMYFFMQDNEELFAILT